MGIPFLFPVDLELESLFGSLWIYLSILSVLVFAVHALLARNGPDDAGERDQLLHFGFVSLVALAVLLPVGFRSLEAAVYAVVADDEGSAISGPGLFEDPGIDFGTSHDDFATVFEPLRDESISRAVALGLITGAALAVYALYRRWLDPLRRRVHEGPGPRHTYRAYLSAVSFLTVVTAVFAVAALGYGVFQAVDPETTGGVFGEDVARDAGTARIVAGVALAVTSVTIFRMHRDEADVLARTGASAWASEDDTEPE